jgi:PAS domain S-box-containing protein
LPTWLAVLVVCLCAFPGSVAAQQHTAKRVLLLFSEYKQRTQFLHAFESSVQAQVNADIKFDEAYLEGREVPQSSDPVEEERDYLEGFAENLRRRFAGVKLDLLVPVGPWALICAERYHQKMLPGVPVVFSAVSDWEFENRIWQGITGVTGHVGLGETIDLALRLEPDTETVALISPNDPPWLAVTHKELSRYQGKVREIDFIGPPGRQLFEEVAALPPHSVVLFHLALQDSGQPALAGFDLLDAVAQRVPTFSAWPNLCLNHGCIGGVYGENTDMIQLTASAAARVLSGEPVDKIPIGHVTGIRPEVDWRALQHWHIAESALPPGTQVLYREPSLWEQGRKYFLGAIAVILIQSLLIFGLFWQHSRRRKAEIELRKSEEKFAKAFRESPLAITIVKVSDGRYVEVNESFEFQTGWSHTEVVGRTPFEIGLWIDPDHRTAFMKQVLTTGNVKDLEVQLRRKDGQIRTSLGSAELIEVNGEPCVLSVFADITERKQAEEAISGFGRRLIEAQEAERTRIARELHDDINQRLAMVAVTVKTAKQTIPNLEIEAGSLLDEAGARVSDLESDIQALSHRLHSSKLEYLGLESAASSFCKELSERQNIKIDFQCDGLPEDLSSEVSLCLFRVLQEALHNAVKYSGVNEFEVAVQATSNEIHLRVHDSGAGFDARLASNGHGLGLTSMKERLKLVSGELSIESEVGRGTTVLARAPLVTAPSAAGTSAQFTAA